MGVKFPVQPCIIGASERASEHASRVWCGDYCTLLLLTLIANNLKLRNAYSPVSRFCFIVENGQTDRRTDVKSLTKPTAVGGATACNVCNV